MISGTNKGKNRLYVFGVTQRLGNAPRQKFDVGVLEACVVELVVDQSRIERESPFRCDPGK